MNTALKYQYAYLQFPVYEDFEALLAADAQCSIKRNGDDHKLSRDAFLQWMREKHFQRCVGCRIISSTVIPITAEIIRLNVISVQKHIFPSLLQEEHQITDSVTMTVKEEKITAIAHDYWCL